MTKKPEYTLNDAVGTRNPKTGVRTYPAVTIGLRNYIQSACVRIRLDDTHFCIKDQTLGHAETVARIEELKALIGTTSRSKAKVDNGS